VGRSTDQKRKSHDTEDNQSHDHMVTNREEEEEERGEKKNDTGNTKPPERTQVGSGHLAGTALARRHQYYEEEEGRRGIKGAYSIPNPVHHPQGQNGPCYCPYQAVCGHARCVEGSGGGGVWKSKALFSTSPHPGNGGGNITTAAGVCSRAHHLQGESLGSGVL